MLRPSLWPRGWVAGAVVSLLAVLVVELAVPLRRQSPVFDEGCHILAGYSYWTRGDFGINPEHPPLVKLLATLPLLPMSPHYPPPPGGFFKVTCFLGGRQFLFSNDADAILTRARISAAGLTLLAAFLVFAAAYEFFGTTVGLIALLLFVFEPNLIAHGCLVTTDMAMALFLFATVYAFYRYVKKPSLVRLLVTSVAAGLCLASKYSGVLLLPILLLLAVSEALLHKSDSVLARGGRARYLLRLTVSLVAVGFVSLVILWAFYGFRFQARPEGKAIAPPFDAYVSQINRPVAEKAISFVARHHLLPEAYLYGFTDVLIAPRYVTPYLFGKVYPHGLWYYPLATFVIKSTMGFLALLLILLLSVALLGVGSWREFLYLSVPSAIYLLAALTSGFNHGNRYLLPLYPFLCVLAAWGAWRLARSHRGWLYCAAALLALHVISSVRAFPDYLPYSNEAWGGSANAYKFLSDSNVDWGQQLKVTSRYLHDRGIKDCWFDYFARGVVDPAYYGIRCQPLPDRISPAFGNSPAIIPSHVEGTLLISQTELSGNLWGPGNLNPYAQLQNAKPDALIAGGLFVFHGQFDLPLAAAATHSAAASQFLDQGKPNEALAEAQAAVLLAQDDVGSQVALGDVMARLDRKDEAKAAYQRALAAAQTNYPDFQSSWVSFIQGKLAGH